MAKELPPEQGRLFTDEVAAPEFHDGVSVDVKARAQNLLKATNALGQVVQKGALPRAMEIASRRRELQRRYNNDEAPNALEEEVLPGAQVNKKELSTQANEAFDAAFGDFEAAKQAAWSQFSPEERAQLELDTPEQDEYRAAFRAKMTDTRRSSVRQDGQPRSRRSRVTVGSVNRGKLKSQMEKTLKRLDGSGEQKAA